MPNMVINTSAVLEYVAEVERRIRVVKERAHAIISLLPFKYIPDVITINLLHFCVFWLNMLPIKAEYSK